MPRTKALLLHEGSFFYEPVCIDNDNFIDEVDRIIDCRCIDIVTAEYNGKQLNMVVDDEGLLKDEPIVNPIAWYLYTKCDKRYPIVGNVLVFGEADSEGNLTDVPHSFKSDINEHLATLAYRATIKALS